MKLNKFKTVKCPSCQNNLTPMVLGCSACHLEIRGHFPPAPFSQLDEDLLHFLNVFIHCEGKIADMEKALGLSYPTVKAKMLRLKEAVKLPLDIETTELKELNTLEILAKIESGEMNFVDGLKLIKKSKENKK